MTVQFDASKAAPAQLVLGAVYAAGAAPFGVRPLVMTAVRKGLAWRGDVGHELLSHLAGRFGSLMSADAFDRLPERSVVQRRFRDAIRDVHPDHGDREDGAAGRIAEITEARRILLAS